MKRTANNNKGFIVSLFFLCLVLGLLLSVRFTSEGYGGYLEHQDQEDLLAIWRNLNEKRDDLEKELEMVRNQKAALAEEASAATNSLTNIQAQLNTLYQVNGLVSVKGPGVEVVFSGEKPLLYMDLIDVVNELWSSGAEGISVNDHRVTVGTSFYFTETDTGIYITVNNKVLKYPIVIRAIGDPNILEKGLTFPGGIVDNLNTLYNIKPSIKKMDSLELPAQSSPSSGLIPGGIKEGSIPGKD